MASSWHAFLYGSFDAAGVMTVDKPPLALWVQALSVRVFGFHSLAMLVPAGADGRRRRSGSCMTSCAGRSAGPPASSAGLALALTPITVAISRHNNPDALLVLCFVAALWFFVRGLEDGRTRWLVLRRRRRRPRLRGQDGARAAGRARDRRGVAVGRAARPLAAVRQLLAGGAAMVVVGVAWPLLMALTPGRRPPVDLGHERQQHLVADLRLQRPRPARRPGRRAGRDGRRRPGGGGGGGVFGGSTGRAAPARREPRRPGRLAARLRPGRRRRPRRSRRGCAARDPRTGWLIAVGGAFRADRAVAFSTRQGHLPPVLRLAARPVHRRARRRRRRRSSPRGERRALDSAPLAIAGGVVTELIVLHNNPGDARLARAACSSPRASRRAAVARRPAPRGVRRVALATALARAADRARRPGRSQTLGHATNGTFPAGGPATPGSAAAGRAAAVPAAAGSAGRPPADPRRRARHRRIHAGRPASVRTGRHRPGAAPGGTAGGPALGAAGGLFGGDSEPDPGA